MQAYEYVNDSKSGEADVAVKFKKLKVARKSKGKFKKKGKKTKKNNSQNFGTKSKGNYFHYNKLEHWKRNYHKHLEELKAKKKGKSKYDLLVLDV